MTSADRWIVLLGLQDTKHIRLKIRRIQVDALEWARANEGIEVLFKIQDLRKEQELKGEEE